MSWWLTPEKFQALPTWAKVIINTTLLIIGVGSLVLFVVINS